MSTPAGIGMVMPDGTIKVIRLNWDGYPSGAGIILGGWYKTQERVKQLLDLGDLSAIGSRLEPDTSKPHTKMDAQDDVVLAFHRDYGEALIPPRVFVSRDEYELNGKSALCADYLYLFDNGKWFVKGLYRVDGWIELTVEVCKKD